MNKQEIEQKYQECVAARIEDAATSFSNNLNFDHFYELCRLQFGYELFFPLGFKGMSFDSVCNLFSRMLYDIDDDGAMSLVHISVEYDCAVEYPWNSVKEPLTHNWFFVCIGDYNELDEAELLKFATTHMSNYKEAKIKEYSACRFNWETLSYLHSLLPEYVRIAKIADSKSWEEGESYFDEYRKFVENFKPYILGNPHVTKHEPQAGVP